jgi:hypothetical protein
VELSQDVNILETFTNKDMKYIVDAIYFYIYEELFNFFTEIKSISAGVMSVIEEGFAWVIPAHR